MIPPAQHPLPIKIFRFIHLALNVVCVGVGSFDWDLVSLLKKLNSPAGAYLGNLIPQQMDPIHFDQEPSIPRMLFLVVTVIIMAASFALLILYWAHSYNTNSTCINPICETIYYGISSVSLCIAASILIAKPSDWIFQRPVLLITWRVAVSVAYLNSAFYLTSALIFWTFLKKK